MKLAILAVAAAAVVPAFAQNNTNATAYLTTVLGALNGAGLTSLATVISQVANSTEGAALLSALPSLANATVLAPSNDAFAAVPQNVSSNTTLLSQVLAYHVLTAGYVPSGVAVSPNHTIGRTALTGGAFALPNNRTQPLVLTRANSTTNSSITVINGGQNITAQGPVAAANLQVYVINQVLSLPPTLGALLTTAAPALAGVATQANLVAPLSAAPLLTIFAPNDAALGAVQGALASLNSTQITTILAGHVINGTAVFSPNLPAAGVNVTAAGGQALTFMTNSTGAYVMSANSTARIISSDNVITNGVVHVIDNVLVNTNANPGAAQSAYESNTAAGPSQTQPTGAVTQTSQPAASGGASGSASASSRSAGELTSFLPLKTFLVGGIVSVVGLVVGGAAVLA